MPHSLIIAEHNHSVLLPSTLNTAGCALKLGGNIDLLVAGTNCQTVADEATNIDGVGNVMVCDDKAYGHFLPEHMSVLIADLAKNYTHILVPSNTFGKNILPRVAGLLDVAQVTDVIEVISEDTFKRPIYAGNAIAAVQSSDAIKLLTVRTTAFDKAPAGHGSASINTIEPKVSEQKTQFVSQQSNDSDGPELTSARVVISGGRGMASGDNFKILESLALKIGDCAIGASRAAVDAGYVPNDMQVGQTGKIVAPELYIAVGISGAIQHLAGMKESKVIVAINKDENAPIFDVSDYGIVGDLFDVIPKLESLI